MLWLAFLPFDVLGFLIYIIIGDSYVVCKTSCASSSQTGSLNQIGIAQLYPVLACAAQPYLLCTDNLLNSPLHTTEQTSKVVKGSKCII